MYKVVVAEGKQLFSVIRDTAFQPKYVVQYIPGQWTVPAVVGTRLFCFKWLANAIAFVASIPNEDAPVLDIWHCRAQEIKATGWVSGGDFEAFWDANASLNAHCYRIAPKGTYMAGSVKLTRPVSPYRQKLSLFFSKIIRVYPRVVKP